MAKKSTSKKSVRPIKDLTPMSEILDQPFITSVRAYVNGADFIHNVTPCNITYIPAMRKYCLSVLEKRSTTRADHRPSTRLWGSITTSIKVLATKSADQILCDFAEKIDWYGIYEY